MSTKCETTTFKISMFWRCLYYLYTVVVAVAVVLGAAADVVVVVVTASLFPTTHTVCVAAVVHATESGCCMTKRYCFPS